MILRPLVIILLTTPGETDVSPCSAMGRFPEGDAVTELQASTHYLDGHFFNRPAARNPAGFEAMKEWMKGSAHTIPDAPIPVLTPNRADLETSPVSGLRITWIGHSTSLVQIDGAVFLIDPVWSKRSSPVSVIGPKRFFEAPIPIDALPRIDAVLISHDHYDHLDKRTVQTLAKLNLRFVVPLGVDARLKGFGVRENQIESLDWWQRTRIRNITITATPARHFSGRGFRDRNKTLWAGFALAGDAHRVYYTGDTGMFPGFVEIGEKLGPFDATLVEIGAYNRLWADMHLGPEQAVQAVRNANGGLLIPVHWATFNLAMHSWVEPAERLMVAAKQSDVPFVIPQPGQSIDPMTPPVPKRWWPDLPWQTVQEHPIIASGMASP